MWMNKGEYYLFQAPQRSNLWHQVRYGRCTASIFYECAKNSERALRSVLGERVPMNEDIKRGIENEPKARKWYENKFKVKVEEIGFAVPKWNLWIGASTDGLVGDDGIIEIKCPRKIYDELRKYIEDSKNGRRVSIKDYIFESYYAQMQGGMAILGRKWCDFIVYCEGSEVFFSRVPFDREYWDTLHREINGFIEKNNLKSLKILKP